MSAQSGREAVTMQMLCSGKGYAQIVRERTAGFATVAAVVRPDEGGPLPRQQETALHLHPGGRNAAGGTGYRDHGHSRTDDERDRRHGHCPSGGPCACTVRSSMLANAGAMDATSSRTSLENDRACHGRRMIRVFIGAFQLSDPGGETAKSKRRTLKETTKGKRQAGQRGRVTGVEWCAPPALRRLRPQLIFRPASPSTSGHSPPSRPSPPGRSAPSQGPSRLPTP